LRDAMFWVAEQLYGLRFEKTTDVPVFHPDVSVYAVTRKGRPVGLWYFDPFARPGKQSGAWMSAYRDQHRLEGDVLTLVSNNSNFIPAAAGEPVTISWDDANTMFHEFGHALHGLNSNVTYPTLSGTNTTRDFVEFPSQFNENFLTTPQVLKFLVNAKGEALPALLVARILKAQTFNEGFATAEAQASAAAAAASPSLHPSRCFSCIAFVIRVPGKFCARLRSASAAPSSRRACKCRQPPRTIRRPLRARIAAASLPNRRPVGR